MRRNDIRLGISSLVIIVLLAFVVIPVGIFVPARVAWTLNSPGFFPSLALVIATILALILVVSGIRAGSTAIDESAWQRSEWARALGMLVVSGLYVGAIFLVGMVAASVAALVLTLLLFGERRLLLILSIALTIPAVLWGFLTYVAGVPMPDYLAATLLQRP